MPKRSRKNPKDPNQTAKSIVEQVKDEEPPETGAGDADKNPAAGQRISRMRGD